MNIFVLDTDPAVAAWALCDKHVPKMLLETAQLLCGVFEPGVAPYRRTHYKHPCAVWTRASFGNFHWLFRYGESLSQEYTNRFGREHASQAVVRWCWKNKMLPTLFPKMEQTPFAQAMPEEFQGPDAVAAYRAYYLSAKVRFARWEHGRSAPEWWPAR